MNAQVCAGGLAVEEVDEQMQVKKYPGLFVTGELLDVDGICGGYNLHWAFATGTIAGKSDKRLKMIRINQVKTAGGTYVRCAPQKGAGAFKL